MERVKKVNYLDLLLLGAGLVVWSIIFEASIGFKILT